MGAAKRKVHRLSVSSRALLCGLHHGVVLTAWLEQRTDDVWVGWIESMPGMVRGETRAELVQRLVELGASWRPST